MSLAVSNLQPHNSVSPDAYGSFSCCVPSAGHTSWNDRTDCFPLYKRFFVSRKDAWTICMVDYEPALSMNCRACLDSISFNIIPWRGGIKFTFKYQITYGTQILSLKWKLYNDVQLIRNIDTTTYNSFVTFFAQLQHFYSEHIALLSNSNEKHWNMLKLFSTALALYILWYKCT